MATSKRAWQKTEQFWAELHGETRNGPRGHNEPDTTNEHCPVGIETKLQEKRCLRSKDLEQAQENAAAMGMPWILVLHTKGTQHMKDDLVVMDGPTYLALVWGLLDYHGISGGTREIAETMIEKVRCNKPS